jgi:predicted phosphodiesterase
MEKTERVAALYDIHGNLPALRAVLAEAREEGVEVFLVGGDVASGPLPGATLDEVVALGQRARFVRGNADREALAAYERGDVRIEEFGGPVDRWAAFTAGQMTPAHRELLAGFTPLVELDVAGLGPTLFCHGSPRSDAENITRVTPPDRLREILAGVEPRTVVCGHTHQQFDRTLDGQRIVNAGSVGLPYEGRPGAYWALLGPDVELRRTEYDVDRALQELAARGFPDLDEMLRESLLDPIDPAIVEDLYEQQARASEDPGTG